MSQFDSDTKLPTGSSDAPDRPLRCLQYLDAFQLERGGVVRAVLDLADGLAFAGVEVTLLTGDANDVPEAWRKPNPPAGVPRIVTIDRRVDPFLRPRCGTDELDRLVGAADVVHLHTPWDPFNRPLADAARRAGKPYLVTIHGMLDDWCLASKAWKKHLYLALGGRRFLQRAAGLHFTAESEQTQSMRRVGSGKPLVIPLAIDAQLFRDLVGPDLAKQTFPDAFADPAPRLLFLGRVHPIKGLDTFVDALAHTNTSSGLKPHLIIAGPEEAGYAQALRMRIGNRVVDDRVHFVGMVDGDVKQSLYQAADAFVLPSHHENFGIALTEAMMCGAPALTSKCVNVWPEIEALGGIVVDHSVDGFAAGIETLLDTLPEMKRVALANRQKVIDWVDHERLTQRYIDAYRTAISG